jgi:hypothetical protein
VGPEERIQELEKSHDQLRGALVAAGMHIRKFRRNSQNNEVIHLLRNVLQKARTVRRKQLETSKS